MHSNAVSSLPSSVTVHDHSSQQTNTHSMLTQSKVEIFKPKALLTHTTPTSVKQALTDTKWLTAMNEEYNALLQKQDMDSC